MDMNKMLTYGAPAVMALVLAVAALNIAGLPVFGIGVGQSNGNAIAQQPAAASPPLAAAGSGAVQRYQIGYKNYAYYFPSTGSDTLVLKKGQPVELEALLSGPDKLVGCMVSQKFPQDIKIDNAADQNRNLFIAKPGNNVLKFTPQKAGTFGFTCGMGMGTGRISVIDN